MDENNYFRDNHFSSILNNEFDDLGLNGTHNFQNAITGRDVSLGQPLDSDEVLGEQLFDLSDSNGSQIAVNPIETELNVVVVSTTHQNEDLSNNKTGVEVIAETIECDTQPIASTSGTDSRTQISSQTLVKSVRKRGRPSLNRTAEEQREATKSINKNSAKGYRERQTSKSKELESKVEELEERKEKNIKTVESLEKQIKICKKLFAKKTNLSEERVQQLVDLWMNNSNNTTFIMICSQINQNSGE